MQDNTWMIYGANGYTGRLIAATAVSQGLRPILAGRSKDRLRPMADTLGLPYRVFSLDDEAVVSKNIGKTRLVVNVAGPFSRTGELLARTCVRNRSHYIDVSNEIPSLRAIYALGGAANAGGVVLLPGAGFGTTASSCLSQFLHERMPAADHLDIVVAPYTRTRSAAASRTVFQVVGRGGYTRRNGELCSHRLGRGSRRMSLPQGNYTIVPAPLGDLEAAYRVTGIKNITTYFTTRNAPLLTNLAFGVMQTFARLPGLSRAMRGTREDDTPVQRPEQGPSDARSFVWARIGQGGSHTEDAWLDMGEGYEVTAQAVLAAVGRILSPRTQPVPGAHTPATAFGADFVLSLSGVNRISDVPVPLRRIASPI